MENIIGEGENAGCTVFKSLPNDKILDVTKLKAFADRVGECNAILSAYSLYRHLW